MTIVRTPDPLEHIPPSAGMQRDPSNLEMAKSETKNISRISGSRGGVDQGNIQGGVTHHQKSKFVIISAQQQTTIRSVGDEDEHEDSSSVTPVTPLDDRELSPAASSLQGSQGVAFSLAHSILPAASTTPRFQVVKVETKEPFRRGRWTCRDYLDQSGKAKDSGVIGSKSSRASPLAESQQGQSSAASNAVSGAGSLATSGKVVTNIGKPALANEIIAQKGNNITAPSASPHSSSLPPDGPSGVASQSRLQVPVAGDSFAPPSSENLDSCPALPSNFASSISSAPRWSVSGNMGTIATPAMAFDYGAGKNVGGFGAAGAVSASVIRSNLTPELLGFGSPQRNDNHLGATSANVNTNIAIDNKIEQAMDLVKTHLMFAVREEVEQMAQKISQLEYENRILRSHASAETLGLLGSTNSNVAIVPTSGVAAPPALDNPQSGQPPTNANFTVTKAPEKS